MKLAMRIKQCFCDMAISIGALVGAVPANLLAAHYLEGSSVDLRAALTALGAAIGMGISVLLRRVVQSRLLISNIDTADTESSISPRVALIRVLLLMSVAAIGLYALSRIPQFF
jgi:dipeptide/tripeptide permease